METLASEKYQHNSLHQPSVSEDNRRHRPHLQKPKSGRLHSSIGTTHPLKYPSTHTTNNTHTHDAQTLTTHIHNAHSQHTNTHYTHTHTHSLTRHPQHTNTQYTITTNSYNIHNKLATHTHCTHSLGQIHAYKYTPTHTLFRHTHSLINTNYWQYNVCKYVAVKIMGGKCVKLSTHNFTIENYNSFLR